jgi:hypothetical protein
MGTANISPWEDHLLERKTEGDLKDLLKTMVAFANSVKPGHTAQILIGEKNDGSAQGVTNAENIQRRVREEGEKIYPAIVYRQIVYEKEGKPCVRVEIDYDGATPHFGGAAWIRDGAETIKANREVFQRLVELRTSKVAKLQEWIDQKVYIRGEPLPTAPFENLHPRWSRGGYFKLVELNQFYAIFESLPQQQGQETTRLAEPLDKLIINWDARNNTPMLFVRL